MEERVLCNIHALRLHRMPPVLRGEVEEHLDCLLGPGRRSFAPAVELLGLPGQPLTLLIDDRALNGSSAHFRTQLCSCELPWGAVERIGSYTAVTSPAFTLFTLARQLCRTHLVMLMHEFCGSFTVFQPTDDERMYLQRAIDAHALPLSGSWRPVLDENGRLTDLWSRPPLVSRVELEKLADDMRGVPGSKSFSHAVKLVKDGAASPFEVQTGMMLGLSGKLGGKGFKSLNFNERIALSREAQLIAGQDVCFADILLSGRTERQAIIECQSILMHARGSKMLADANRLAALQSMDYLVVPLTFGRLVEARRFDSLVRHVKRELGLPIVPQTEPGCAREARLRSELFVDWGKLGMRR